MYFHRSESHILTWNNKMHRLWEMHTVHQDRVKPLLLFVINLAFKRVLWQETRVREVSSTVPLRVLSLLSSRNKTLYSVSPIPCLVPNAGERQFEQQNGPQGRSAQRRGKGPSHADLRSCRSIFWERLVQGTIKRKTRRRTSRDQIELVVQEDSPILFRDA